MPQFDIKKQGRRLGIAGLVLLLLSVVANLITIPVDPARVRSLILPALGTFSEPDTTFDLRASLSVFPRPVLQLTSINISFKNQISIKAASARVSLSLAALLGGTLDATSLELQDPTISIPGAHLPESRQGILALIGSTIRLSDELSSPPISLLRFQNAHIVSARLPNVMLFDHLDSDLSFGDDGRLIVDLKTLYKNEPIELRLRIDPLDPKTGTKPARVAIKSKPMTLALNGAVASDPATHFNGKIDLDITALDQFGRWMQIDPPLLFSTNLLLKGEAEFAGDRVAVRDAEITLGKAAMKGGIGIDFSASRPVVVGSLSAGDLDVTEFLSPIWPKQAQGWRTDPLSESLTPQQDFDVRLSADRVNLGIVRISNVALSIMAKDRVLDLTFGGAKIFQGSTKGKISIAPLPTGYSVVAHGSFENIDLAQATLALMDLRKIEGSTDGKFDFESRGQTPDAIMKALGGQIGLSISNGTISGINLGAVLKRIETRPLSAIRDMKGGKTDFDHIDLSAQINDGIAALDAAEMLFPPNTMTIKGKVNIGGRGLALEGLATGPESENGVSPAILPYTITGTFDDPVVTPDVGRILRRQGTPPQPSE